MSICHDIAWRVRRFLGIPMSESEALTSLVCLDIVSNYSDWTHQEDGYHNTYHTLKPKVWNAKLPKVTAKKGDFFYYDCKIGRIPISRGQFKRILKTYKKQEHVIEQRALFKEFEDIVDNLLERRK